MSPRSVLVTGANRGIGLGLVKEFLKDEAIEVVIATGRNTLMVNQLTEIDDSRLKLIELDVDDDDSIQEAYGEVKMIVGEGGLNVLVNNAGIFVSYYSEGHVSRRDLANQLNTNTISTVLTTQMFLPLLKKAVTFSLTDELAYHRASILNISSGWASIEENSTGSGETGSLAYRMSKAALNSATKTLAVDLKSKGILTAAFCPGWVKTEMGGSNAVIPVEESASILISTFKRLRTDDSGKFFQHTGEIIPF